MVIQLIQFVDLRRECRFDTEKHMHKNIGKLSGRYTDGTSLLACATPCCSGSILISSEVIEHRVALWIKPAPKSVRVCDTHMLSRAHNMVT
jgi:hypothetical protein